MVVPPTPLKLCRFLTRYDFGLQLTRRRLTEPDQFRLYRSRKLATASQAGVGAPWAIITNQIAMKP